MMKRLWLSMSVLLLLTVVLNGCANIQESGLLVPTRSRPELGVRLRVTPPSGLSKSVIGERHQVLLVIKVKPETSAAKAGVQVGDILLSINGKPVSGMGDSVAEMQTHQWGEELMLTILRDGRVRSLVVPLQPKSS